LKAFRRDSYGSPDVLELRDIAMPVIRDDGVLVRVARGEAVEQAS
jgi:NADPH:quinone reductase-like Zn-dependent oxidoreductase